MIDYVVAKQGVFLSDEIYHGLVYEEGVASALEFSNQVFVINSFSKYFGMTGWRAGWLIVPETYVQATEKLAQNIFISTSSHSQYAALAAFDKQTLQILEVRRKDFKLKRDFLYNALLKMGFDILVKPAGAFYIYADCSQLTHDSWQFAKDLLEQEGLAITPGKDFGENDCEKYCRFSYTASMEQQISPMDLQFKLSESSTEYCLVDVREPFEYEITHIENSVLMPMHTIADNLDKLDKTKALVIICHHGIRSQQVAYFLDQQGSQKVFNLTGGIDAWSCICDKNVVRY